MTDKDEKRHQENLEDQKDDAAKKPSDYNGLKGIATVGLNVALFGNTVADMKNFYDIKERNESPDVYVVLWLLRLSFCFQICVALLAILLYMMDRKDNKDQEKESKKYKPLTIYDPEEPEPRSRFQRLLFCGKSMYQMLYLASLVCILIITTIQIIASIWSANLGLELKSAIEDVGPYESHSTMNPKFTTTVNSATSTYNSNATMFPNFATAMESTTSAYKARNILTTRGTTTAANNYHRICGPNRACVSRQICGSLRWVDVYR